MNSQDLSEFLKLWPYETGKVNARRIQGDDGKPKLQIRVDLGVLQMEMTGRPDGLRPSNHETLLALHQEKLAEYTRHTQSSTGFVLSSQECRDLRDEALQYYHRYVGLFAITDYSSVIRDTRHNLAIFDMCRDYASTPADRDALEPFRASVLMMRSRSEAELAIVAGKPKDAMAALDRGLSEIRTALEEAGQGELFDHANEVQLLRGMRDALVPKLPPSQKAELLERLQAAIAAENYELAAILRDELRMMKD